VPPVVEDRTERDWEPISLTKNDQRRVNMPARRQNPSVILPVMKLGNVARVVAVVAGCVAAAGSATSTSNQHRPSGDPQMNANSPPASQQMDPTRALGLWKSTFGAVKIEPDERNGGLQAGNVQGAWMYQRQGREVIGLFWGSLQGNTLKFHWQEPPSGASNEPLSGEGYLVFDPAGRQYSGRWWSDHRDRVGDWNGWRADGQLPPDPSYDPQGQGQYGPSPGHYDQGSPPPQGNDPGQELEGPGADRQYAPPPQPPRRKAPVEQAPPTQAPSGGPTYY